MRYFLSDSMENTKFLWKFGLVTASTLSSSTLRTIWIAPLLFSRATKFTYLNKVNYNKVTKKRGIRPTTIISLTCGLTNKVKTEVS